MMTVHNDDQQHIRLHAQVNIHVATADHGRHLKVDMQFTVIPYNRYAFQQNWESYGPTNRKRFYRT